jgi:hypothetical protein
MPQNINESRSMPLLSIKQEVNKLPNRAGWSNLLELSMLLKRKAPTKASTIPTQIIIVVIAENRDNR